MLRLRFFISLFVVVLFTTGCESSEIALVKSATLGIDNTVTIGNVFDSYQHIKNGQWESFETERGAIVVSFTADYLNSSFVKYMLGAEDVPSDESLVPFIAHALTQNLDERKFHLKLEVQFTIAVDSKSFEVTYFGYEVNGISRKLDINGAIRDIYQNDPAIMGFAHGSDELWEFNYLQSKCTLETIQKIQPHILTTYKSTNILKDDGSEYDTQPVAQVTLRDMKFDDVERVIFANMQISILDIAKFTDKSDAEVNAKKADVLQVFNVALQATSSMNFMRKGTRDSFYIFYHQDKNPTSLANFTINRESDQQINQALLNFLMAREN